MGLKMDTIQQMSLANINTILTDDPVRPHISAEDRYRVGEVYSLYEQQFCEFAEPLYPGRKAVICVAFTSDVPKTEQEMFDLADPDGKIAVFYTVWSYVKGAGRNIVNETYDYIKNNMPNVERFVTLSPKTEMARRFHLKNGAFELSNNQNTINYEYPNDL